MLPAISSETFRHVAIAAALGAIVISLGALRLTPRVCGVYHDDGIYVSTAKALAEGHGYRLVNLPGAPPQTKYPPLFPAVLAPIWSLWPDFPSNLVALQAVSLLSAALAVVLAYGYFVRFRHADASTCALAGAICATTPSFIYFATQTLSESLFALAVVAAVWSFEAGGRSSRAGVGEFTRGFVGTLPFLCRSIGICFYFPAVVRFFRRPQGVVAYAAGALVAAAPWVAWIATHLKQSAQPAAAYYTVQNYLSWWAIDASVLRVVLLNVFWILMSIGTLQAEGLAALSSYIEGGFIVVILAIFTVLGGAVCLTLVRSRRFDDPLVLFFCAYLAIIVFWPWPPPRFLVPLTPLLTLFFLIFVQRMAARFVPRRSAICVWLVAALVISTNLVQQVRVIAVVRETGYPHAGVPEEPISWTPFVETFRWLQANTEADAVIASGLDTMVYLYTGRQSIRPFVQRPTGLYYFSAELPLGTAAEFRNHLLSSGADYVLKLPMQGFREEQPLADLIQETLTSRPGCLQEKYRLPGDSRFVVYAVVLSRCAN